MSVLRRCEFYKATDGYWYLILGDFEYAEDLYDCSIYGAFSSYNEVNEFLTLNFSNPGNLTVDDSGQRKPPRTQKRLAVKNYSRSHHAFS